MKICPQLCKICSKKYYSKGYCRTHYERWKRYGDPNLIKTTSVNKSKCIICGKKWHCKDYCKYHYNKLPELVKKSRQRSIKYQNNHPIEAFKRWYKYMTKLGSSLKLTPNQYKHALISWSQAVKKRDNYTCQVCGSKENVEAHHILHKNKYLELSFNINNGITLCRKRCHLEAHNKLSIEIHTVI